MISRIGKSDRRSGSPVMMRDMEAARLAVEMRDPQCSRAGSPASKQDGEEAARSLEPVEERR